MKTTKKLLAVVLAVMMVVAMVPATVAFAADATVSSDAELVAAVADGGNITIGADFTLSSKVEVPADKTVTIDFNGHTITYDGTWKIDNYGTLTYKDSSANGNGGISCTKGVTHNYGGTMTVDGGKYTLSETASGSAFMNKNGGGTLTVNKADITAPYYGIYNYSDDNGASPTVVINDGCKINDAGNTASSKFSIYNGSNCKMTINGCEVNTSFCAVRNEGDLEINGGSFVSTSDNKYGRWSYCVSNYAGSLVMNGGTIQGIQGGLFAKGGTVTINGGTIKTVDTNNNGHDYHAIYAGDGGDAVVIVNDGTFESDTHSAVWVASPYTDVTIEGGTFTSANDSAIQISSGVEETLTINDGTFSGTSTVKVIGGSEGTQTYDNLISTAEQLKTAAATGGTYVLGADVELTEALVIPEGVELTLNICGNNIKGTVNGKMIQNKGTLTLDGPGCVYNTDVSAQGHDAVTNYGTITINGGVYGDKNKDMTDANDVNRGPGFRNYGTAVINGGYFTACDNYTGPGNGYAYAIINANGGELTINDAVVYGKNNGNVANDGGNVTINGGTYTLDGEKSYCALYTWGGNTITVNGGTFNHSAGRGGLISTNEGDDSNGIVILNDGTFNYTKLTSTADGKKDNVQVNGGTFSTDVTYYEETVMSGDGKVVPIAGNQSVEEADDNQFGLTQTTYKNLELLGVQTKAAKDEALRFISVINSDIIKSADDYGYIIGTTSKAKADAMAAADQITVDNAKDYMVSCMGTSNQVSGDYGVYDTDTSYKYITAAVEGITDTSKVIFARVYVTKNGKTYYGDYINGTTYGGCATSFADLG